MPFNSFSYALFLPLVWLISHCLGNRFRWQLLLRAPDLAPLLAQLALPPGWTLDVDPVSML